MPRSIAFGLLALCLASCTAPQPEGPRPGITQAQYDLIVQQCDYEAEKATSEPGLLHDYQASVTASKCITFKQSELQARKEK